MRGGELASDKAGQWADCMGVAAAYLCEDSGEQHRERESVCVCVCEGEERKGDGRGGIVLLLQ
jgi:hypothetical protein